MITKDQYESAVAAKAAADKTIQEYSCQKIETARHRWQEFRDGVFFKDADLTYSATARCHCGAGLAHPKDCPPHHQWTCAAVLKGEGKELDDELGPKHEAYPFAFYEIKSENQPSAYGATTRPASDNPTR